MAEVKSQASSAREKKLEDEVSILRWQVNTLITVCNELKACIESLTIVVERMDDSRDGKELDELN